MARGHSRVRGGVGRTVGRSAGGKRSRRGRY